MFKYSNVSISVVQQGESTLLSLLPFDRPVAKTLAASLCHLLAPKQLELVCTSLQLVVKIHFRENFFKDLMKIK